MKVWLFGNVSTLSSAHDPTQRVTNRIIPILYTQNQMTIRIFDKNLNEAQGNPLTSSGTSLNSSGGGL